MGFFWRAFPTWLSSGRSYRLLSVCPWVSNGLKTSSFMMSISCLNTHLKIQLFAGIWLSCVCVFFHPITFTTKPGLQQDLRRFLLVFRIVGKAVSVKKAVQTDTAFRRHPSMNESSSRAISSFIYQIFTECSRGFSCLALAHPGVWPVLMLFFPSAWQERGRL